MTKETYIPGLSLIIMLIRLLVGTAFSYLIWKSQLPLRISANLGDYTRRYIADTGINRICIITSALYLNSELRDHPEFCVFFGFMAGLVDGIFWGDVATICAVV